MQQRNTRKLKKFHQGITTGEFEKIVIERKLCVFQVLSVMEDCECVHESEWLEDFFPNTSQICTG